MFFEQSLTFSSSRSLHESHREEHRGCKRGLWVMALLLLSAAAAPPAAVAQTRSTVEVVVIVVPVDDQEESRSLLSLLFSNNKVMTFNLVGKCWNDCWGRGHHD